MKHEITENCFLFNAFNCVLIKNNFKKQGPTCICCNSRKRSLSARWLLPSQLIPVPRAPLMSRHLWALGQSFCFSLHPTYPFKFHDTEGEFYAELVECVSSDRLHRILNQKSFHNLLSKTQRHVAGGPTLPCSGGTCSGSCPSCTAQEKSRDTSTRSPTDSVETELPLSQGASLAWRLRALLLLCRAPSHTPNPAPTLCRSSGAVG